MSSTTPTRIIATISTIKPVEPLKIVTITMPYEDARCLAKVVGNIQGSGPTLDTLLAVYHAFVNAGVLTNPWRDRAPALKEGV